jgi:uncharacterized protein
MMKNRNTIHNIGFLVLGLLLLLPMYISAFAAEIPPLKTRVNDYAAMLSPATISQLDNSLAAFEAAESTQIVVLTIPGLGGEAIEDFSIRVADAWKIGQKGLDNGAILLIAKNDRKLRIEVGYGLEGKLTDLISGRIIQQVIIPQFRAGNFDQGIISGVNAMMGAVKGEFKAPDKQKRSSRKNVFGHNSFIMLIVFGFLIVNLGRVSRSLGTLAGGIVLPIFGVMALTGSLILFLALIPVGLFGGYMLSRIGSGMIGPAIGHRRRSTGGIYWGGGGFSSGGFGGFGGGGGGFGGGGASGGW